MISDFLSCLSIGKYPLKAKDCPFIPEAIIASRIEDGPTNGITLMFFWCASFTISAPGSATPGQPASDNKPIVLPSKQGLIKLGKSSGCVCLFNSKSVKLGWDFSGEILLINFLKLINYI